MKGETRVTEKKLAANRQNANRSTGPRTERGKNNSRFNAVKNGLFAKYVVIPMCDGDGSQSRFNELLSDLHQEYRPLGPLEEFCVEEMAKSLWRLRRATRAESAFAQESLRSGLKWRPSTYQIAKPILDRYHILADAEREIRRTGTLSPEKCKAVSALLPEEPAAAKKAIVTAPVPTIDEDFLIEVVCEAAKTSDVLDLAVDESEDSLQDFHAATPLGSEENLNQILRYEKRARKTFDWAFKRLWESQSWRLNGQATASVAVSNDEQFRARQTDNSTERRLPASACNYVADQPGAGS